VPRNSIVYKKHKVRVVEVHDQKHLFINGEHIPVTADPQGGRYRSAHLPYQKFSSLHDLAKAIVDYRNLDKKQG
jgi:hypothetical protein